MNIQGNQEYQVLSPYNGTHNHVLFRHKCGYEWLITPNNFLYSENRCPKCSYNYRTHEEFSAEVHDKYDGAFSVISKFKNTRSKVTVKHLHCGSEFEIFANIALKNLGCRICSRKSQTKTHKQFVDEVRELTDGSYLAVSEYRSAKTKIKMRHLECGEEYKVTPSDFLQDRRCPKCKSSKGK